MLDRYIKTKVFTWIYSAFLLIYAVYFLVNGWDSYRLNVGDFTNTGIIMVNDFMYMGIQGLVLIASVMLVVSSRLSDAMLPVLLLAVISTACYDSSSKFLSLNFIWVAPIAVFAIVFHFIKYRKTFKIGASFFGVCAVAVAITLGGIGCISFEDYFRGTSLFYMFGLGIGLILFYLLIKSQMGEDEKQNVARIMYLVGLLAAFSIFWLYVLEWDISIDVGKMLKPQFSNNLSTLMMMALPFTIFYPSRKHHCLDFLAFLFIYSMVILSGSRGGQLFATIEVLLLLTVYSFFFRKGRASILPRILFIAGTVASVALVWYYLPECADFLHLGCEENVSRSQIIKHVYSSLFNSEESRVGMFERMFVDFKSNPIFGAGLGSTSNTDLYSPVKGAMVWYHMWIAQIVGSLGLVGIAAYGYQLFGRVRIYFKNSGNANRAFFFSYIGLLLMSQVNPGEFCPVPYAMLAVTCFALIESPEDDIPFLDFFKKRKQDDNRVEPFEADV